MGNKPHTENFHITSYDTKLLSSASPPGPTDSGSMFSMVSWKQWVTLQELGPILKLFFLQPSLPSFTLQNQFSPALEHLGLTKLSLSL